jgi:hypothetical protein
MYGFRIKRLWNAIKELSAVLRRRLTKPVKVYYRIWNHPQEGEIPL